MRKLAAVLISAAIASAALPLASPAHAAGGCSPAMWITDWRIDPGGTVFYTINVTASPTSDIPGGCTGDATFEFDGFGSSVAAGTTQTFPGRSPNGCNKDLTGQVSQGGNTGYVMAYSGVLPPNKPNQPNLVSAQPTSLTVNWTPVVDTCHPVDTYQVTVGLGGATVTAAGTLATLDGLQPGTTYAVSVIASNSAGTTQGDARTMSTSTSPTPVPVKTPSAPQNLAASNTQTTTTHLTWTAPASIGSSPVTSYQVLLNGRLVTTVTGLAADLSGLAPNTGYTVAVAAVNASGAGTQATVAVRTQSAVVPTKVPGAVVNLHVSTKSSTNAVIDWSAPVTDGGSAVTGYVVKNVTTGEQRQMGPTTTEAAFTLQPATAYTFSVVAFNANGPGAGATTSVTTDPSGTPDKSSQTITADPHSGKAWRSGKSHYVGGARSSAGVKVRWSAKGTWVKSFELTRKGSKVYMTVTLKKGAPNGAPVTIDAVAKGTSSFDPAHVTNGVTVQR